MDAQLPPQLPLTEMIAQLTIDQELELFDEGLAALCKTKEKKPAIITAADIYEQAEANREIYTGYQRKIAKLKQKCTQLSEQQKKIDLMHLDLLIIMKQKNLELAEQLDATKKETTLLHQQLHDNQIHLNQERLALDSQVQAIQETCVKLIAELSAKVTSLESHKAEVIQIKKDNAWLQSRMRLLGSISWMSFIGLIAAFCIWFDAHKAEYLK